VSQVAVAGMSKNSPDLRFEADFLDFRLWEESGSRVERMPAESHPSSKLAGTPIRDDETVAKMGHSKFVLD